MALMRHQRGARRPDLLGPVDRLLDEWMRGFPMRMAVPEVPWTDEHVIRVDEFQEADALVIRAELPGVDPDKDVEITVAEGMLHIEAERREEEEAKERGYVRKELRYGSFRRTLPLPPGVSESDIAAAYDNGVLEVRVPLPKEEAPERRKVAISKR